MNPYYPITPLFQSEFDARWVDNKEQVINTPVIRDSIFMDKNKQIFYMKTPTNDIKTYQFEEYVEKDEKDLKIEELMKRVEMLEQKGSVVNESVIQQPKQQSNFNVTKIQPIQTNVGQ